MDSLIHADIFFFVTTIVVVIVGAALTAVLVYLARVLSDIKKITAQVHEETVLFREDIRGLRQDMQREGFKIARFIDFFKKLLKHKKTSRSKNS
ncbi:MAG: hypothetical protein ABSC29_04035 [Minisyncoccia bacterium]|jgi:hypothetical protein